MPKKSTSNALEILSQLTGPDPAMKAAVAREMLNREIAQKIYDLREEAGLSQAELARKVGTTQSVISRLEDSDYNGHSLSMLYRIGAAFDRRVEIRFLPATARSKRLTKSTLA